ncbi:MAG: hypothetical protein WD226_02655 [Planctomycetota bacterium]
MNLRRTNSTVLLALLGLLCVIGGTLHFRYLRRTSAPGNASLQPPDPAPSRETELIRASARLEKTSAAAQEVVRQPDAVWQSSPRDDAWIEENRIAAFSKRQIADGCRSVDQLLTKLSSDSSMDRLLEELWRIGATPERCHLYTVNGLTLDAYPETELLRLITILLNWGSNSQLSIDLRALTYCVSLRAGSLVDARVADQVWLEVIASQSAPIIGAVALEAINHSDAPLLGQRLAALSPRLQESALDSMAQLVHLDFYELGSDLIDESQLHSLRLLADASHSNRTLYSAVAYVTLIMHLSSDESYLIDGTPSGLTAPSWLSLPPQQMTSEELAIALIFTQGPIADQLCAELSGRQLSDKQARVGRRMVGFWQETGPSFRALGQSMKRRTD